MTRKEKEAIEILNEDLEWAKQNRYPYISEQKQEALRMAIEALNQRKEGHWRPIYQGDEIIGYRCSECEFGRTGSIYRANYCHNCGAKMKVGE